MYDYPQYVCPSCQHSHTDLYCSECGEKRIDQSDLSIKSFLADMFAGITYLDNKAIRTLKALLFMPGELSLAFVGGKKKPYWSPFQLFLIINLFYFLFFSAADIFFNFWMNAQNIKYFGIDVNIFADKIMSQKGLSALDFEQRFNSASINNSKAWLAICIPIGSLLSYLLFFLKRKYIALHLVFVTHLFSFLLAFMFIWIVIVTKIIGITRGNMIFLPIDCAMYLYTFFAVHRFFKTPWWWSLLGSVALAYGLEWIVFHLYRSFIAVVTAMSV